MEKRSGYLMEDRELVRLAHEARKLAYAPYSYFLVGAALCTENGKVYTGCNIENASYGATNCAERTAVFKAVSEGEREFLKIAVVGGKRGEKECPECFPCGICRQVMAEFCNPDTFVVLLEDREGKIIRYRLRDLLPDAFVSQIQRNVKGNKSI